MAQGGMRDSKEYDTIIVKSFGLYVFIADCRRSRYYVGLSHLHNIITGTDHTFIAVSKSLVKD